MPDAPAGAGPVAVGGFAFAPEGGSARHWAGFAAGDLVVPEVAVARRRGEVALTLAALLAPDDDAAQVAARLQARAAELRSTPLPLLDPAPAGRFHVESIAPPEHYEGAVARAVERIRAGDFEKIVLAREVAVHAPAPHDAAAVFGVLRAAFGSCFVFCAGRGDAAFVAASPELLVRREGQRASTVALAGSIRRSADPAVDDHLGEQLLRSDKDREEQRIVARRIARALRPHAVWVTAPDEPAIIKVANIQHLATPIRAQLTHPRSAIELAGLLHPTPAVGGEPHAVAAPQIPALEGLDRGWYAGPGRLDRRQRGRRVLRRAALRAAARQRGAAVRGGRRRARLRPGGRAGRDRGQARRAAPDPERLRAPARHRRRACGSRARPTPRAAPRGVARLGRAAEGEHRGDRVVLAEPQRAVQADAVADPVRARADALGVRRQQHVLDRAAGVDPGAAVHHDRDHERRAADVGGLEHRLGDGLDGAVVAHDEERPRLAVLRAAGHPARVEDPPLGLGLERARRVLADLAAAHDPQVRLHGPQPSRRHQRRPVRPARPGASRARPGGRAGRRPRRRRS